jgi:hypothetical protein
VSVTVEPLLDAVADHPRRLAAAFPGTPAGGWDRVRTRFPETVGSDDRWRLPVYAYLLTGDAFNHPMQISEPDIPSGADADPVAAARTRREVLERLGPRVRSAGAHLPGGWWTP